MSLNPNKCKDQILLTIRVKVLQQKLAVLLVILVPAFLLTHHHLQKQLHIPSCFWNMNNEHQIGKWIYNSCGHLHHSPLSEATISERPEL